MAAREGDSTWASWVGAGAGGGVGALARAGSGEGEKDGGVGEAGEESFGREAVMRMGEVEEMTGNTDVAQ
ncbi:hypothetical protein E2562_011106 [Oryza meyeriana var. granulata]|uniref:Uncharacterized protein n=1 Tax=Oryza meyeriana var. granulata TaxID=110450 RepID=A0A6G1EWT4_9ORYZ|nr:hypothetical protein E2562_011106 [Oryza meyeriana var. granulata]